MVDVGHISKLEWTLTMCMFPNLIVCGLDMSLGEEKMNENSGDITSVTTDSDMQNCNPYHMYLTPKKDHLRIIVFLSVQKA